MACLVKEEWNETEPIGWQTDLLIPRLLVEIGSKKGVLSVIRTKSTISDPLIYIFNFWKITNCRIPILTRKIFAFFLGWTITRPGLQMPNDSFHYTSVGKQLTGRYQ